MNLSKFQGSTQSVIRIIHASTKKKLDLKILDLTNRNRDYKTVRIPNLA